MIYQRKQLCINYLKARQSFLEQEGRKPKVVKHQSNPGYDIECEHENSKISVKMITAENKYGRTSKINPNWDELIGIELDEDLEVKNFGVITRADFLEEQKRKNQSTAPNFSRTMFKENGVFNIAGRLLTIKEIVQYNFI